MNSEHNPLRTDGVLRGPIADALPMSQLAGIGTKAPHFDRSSIASLMEGETIPQQHQILVNSSE